MTALETLKHYTHGKKNTDKVEISVLALNRIIKALSQECVGPTQKDVGNTLDMRCDDAISRDWLKTAIHNFYYGLKHTPSEEDIQAYIDAAPFVTQKPTEGDDTVSRGVFEQVMRERDIAIEQLHELGYELGQKIEQCEDAVSREDALMCLTGMFKLPLNYNPEDLIALFSKRIKALPSVTQQTGTWIDYSDDGFVECPFCGHATNCEDNIDELHYCFYCGARMIEPQERSKEWANFAKDLIPIIDKAESIIEVDKGDTE